MLYRVEKSFPGGEPGDTLSHRELFAKAHHADLEWLIKVGTLTPMPELSSDGPPVEGPNPLAEKVDALEAQVREKDKRIAELEANLNSMNLDKTRLTAAATTTDVPAEVHVPTTGHDGPKPNVAEEATAVAGVTPKNPPPIAAPSVIGKRNR